MSLNRTSQALCLIELALTHRRSLYRRSLKLALDWTVHRQVWRGQAVYIRSLFEANKDVRDPRQRRVSAVNAIEGQSPTLHAQIIIQETEELLEKWKHPDPYLPPTAPGGESCQSCAGDEWFLTSCPLQVQSTSATYQRQYSTVSRTPRIDCSYAAVAEESWLTGSPAPPHMTL